ncbi:hypothetical protein [Caballeronia sp. LZ001]|uniref:hypothetical protein n=1 Tax=Caballeronia sp. LZ001 TaxID=3038553 RepID=UPI002860F266|nr:hypothetical protein [Caballeronia sp. LZ001]MDR5800611.1 hypothetical protein [Caballeronia sp. LZ001]
MKPKNEIINAPVLFAESREALVATPALFAKMLTRNIPDRVIPEARLIIAVLRQAAADAQAEWKKFLRSQASGNARPIPAGEFMKKPSIRFWTSGGMPLYAELVGLDPGFVYEQFAKHLGIDLKAVSCVCAPAKQSTLPNSAQQLLGHGARGHEHAETAVMPDHAKTSPQSMRGVINKAHV